MNQTSKRNVILFLAIFVLLTAIICASFLFTQAPMGSTTAYADVAPVVISVNSEEGGTVSTDGTSITKVYDAKYIQLEASYGDNAGVFQWQKKKTSETYWTNYGEPSRVKEIENVSDSAMYRCVVNGDESLISDEYTVTISPKEIGLEWSDTVFTYDRNEHCPTATATNTCELQMVDVSVSGAVTNAGKDYVATAYSLDDENYVLPADNEQTFTIDPIAIDVGWSNETLTYTGNINYPKAIVENAVGIIDGDVVTVRNYVHKTKGGSATQPKDVGEYTVTVILSNSNYVATAGTVTKAYQIYPKVVAISWTNLSFVYDKTKHEPIATVKTGDLVGTDACDVKIVTLRDSTEVEAINADTYTAKVKTLTNSNYCVAPDASYDQYLTITKEFTVSKKAVEVVWSNTSLTYNGNQQKPEAAANNLCEDDSCSLTVDAYLGITATDSINASATAYTAKVSAVSNNNYRLPVSTETELYAKLSCDYRIAAKLVTLDWSATTTTFVYNKTEQKPDIASVAISDGLCGMDACAVATATIVNRSTGSLTSPIYVAGYTIKAATLSNSNYRLATAEDDATIYAAISVDFDITPKVVEIAWINTEVTYNGSAQAPVATISNVCEGDSCTPTFELYLGDVKTEPAIDAKTYTATVISINNGNYRLPLAEAIEEASEYNKISNAFVIKQVIATLEWADLTGLIYNAHNQTPTASVENVCMQNGTADSVTVTIKFKKENNELFGDGITAPINVAKYNVQATELSNSNYRLATDTDADYNDTYKPNYNKVFEIEQKEIGISWSNTTLTYNGAKQYPTASVTGYCTEDEGKVGLTSANLSEGYTEAGSYSVSVVSLTNGNYKFTGTPTTNFIITAKTVSILFSNNTGLVYDGNKKSIGATVGSFVEGDTVNIDEFSGNQSATKAGEYTYIATKLDNNNYKLPDEKDRKCVWTIGQAPLIANISLAYGETLIYEGGKKDFEINLTTIYSQNGELDDVTPIVYDNCETGSQGNYVVTVSGILGTDSANYQLSESSFSYDYTIVPKTLNSITFHVQDYYYDGTEKTVTAEVTEADGKIGSDSFMLTLTGDKATVVGDYTVKVSGLGNDNYALPDIRTSFECGWKIMRAQIRVIIDPKTSVYGAEQAKLTYTVVETNGSTANMGDVTLIKEAGLNVGKYDITGSIASEANHEVSYEGGNDAYEITPKEVEVVFGDNIELTYDGSSHTISISFNNVLAADAETVGVATFEGVQGAEDAGSYFYTILSLNNSNYKLPSNGCKCDWEIEQAQLSTAFVAPLDSTYNGIVKTFNIKLTTVYSNDSVSATYEYDQATPNAADVGTYYIHITGIEGTDSDNYVLSDEAVRDYNYTIGAKTLTGITYEIPELYYDGDMKDIASYVTVKKANGKLDADQINLTVIGNEGRNADTYTVTVKSLDNDNYALPATGLSCEWEIKKAQVNITITEASTVYGEAILDSLEYSLADIAGKGTQANIGSVVVTKANQKDGTEGEPDVTVGTYKVVITYSNANHELILTNPTDALYTISAREVTVKFVGTEELVYDGTQKTIGVELGNLASINGVKDVVAVSGDTGDDYAVNARTYTYTITGLTKDNYKLPSVGCTCVWTIGKAQLDIEFVAPTSLVYDGNVKFVGINLSTIYSQGDVLDNVRPIRDDDSAASVGDYSVTVTGLAGTSKDNYEIASTANATYNYAVTAKRLTGITFDVRDYFYNGSERTVSASVAIADGRLGTDYINLTVSGDRGTDAGQYVIKVTDLDNDNYALPTDEELCEKIWNIKKAQIEVTIDTKTSVYGNGLAQLTCSVNSVNGSSINLGTVGLEKELGDDVGTYDIIGSFTSDNHEVTFIGETDAYTITKRTVTVAFDGKDGLVYNGEVKTIAVVFGNLVNDDAVAVKGADGDASATLAGGYTYTVNAIDNGNYKLPSSGCTCNWSIGQAELEIDFVAPMDLTYNKTAKTVSATLTTVYSQMGIKDDVSAVIVYKDSGDNNCDAINAGAYTATVTTIIGEDSANYKIKQGEDLDCDFTVNKKTVTYAIDDIEIAYGSPLAAFTYDYADGSERVIDGDDIGDIRFTCLAASDSEVDFYIIYGSMDDQNDNYEVFIEDGEYRIFARELTVGVNRLSKIYDATAAAPAVSYYVYGEESSIANCSAGLSFVVENDAINVGVYDVICSYSNMHNYNVIFENYEDIYTVSPRVAYISYDGYQNLYYDGTEKVVAVSLTNVVNSDRVDLEVEGNRATLAGDYTVTVALAAATGENKNANYTLSVNNRELDYTIAPNNTKISRIAYFGCDNLTYNGSVRVVTAKAFDANNNVVCDLVLEGNEAIFAGTYNAKVVGTADANYALPTSNAPGLITNRDWTIAKIALYYIIDNQNGIYGDSIKSLTGYLDNDEALVASDTLATLGITLTMTGTDAGRHAITGTSTAKNYEVHFSAGEYVIAPRALSVVFSGTTNGTKNWIYGGSVVTVGINLQNVVVGDDVKYNAATMQIYKNGVLNNSVLKNSGADFANITDDVATYKLVVSGIAGADIANYSFDESFVEYAVEQREVGIAFANYKNLVYNGKAQVVEVTLSNVVANDDAGIITEGTTNTNAGAYTAKVTGLNNANYKLPASYNLKQQAYTIAKASDAIVITKDAWEFNLGTVGSIVASSLSGNEVIFKRVENSTKTVIANSFGSEKGRYLIALTTAGDTNYKAAAEVYVDVVVNVTDLESAAADFKTNASFDNSLAPEASLVVTKAANQDATKLKYAPANRDEQVLLVLDAYLIANGVSLESNNGCTLTMALSDSLKNSSVLKVMYKYNGAYVEKTVNVASDGTITFSMEEIGQFAIVGDKDVSIREHDGVDSLTVILCCVVGALLIVLILVVVLLRRKRLLTFSTINARGAYAETIAPMHLRRGDTIPMGLAPKCDGFVFGGWYLDRECQVPLKSDKMPARNLKLFAKWIDL